MAETDWHGRVRTQVHTIPAQSGKRLTFVADRRLGGGLAAFGVGDEMVMLNRDQLDCLVNAVTDGCAVLRDEPVMPDGGTDGG